MTDSTLQQRFEARIRELLVMLPYDLKVLFEAMSDGDLTTDARLLAAGAVVYCLAPSDPIPDSMGLVGFVDDAVVVRLTLARLEEIGGDEFGDYPERFREQFEQLEDDVSLLRSFLGENIRWVDDRLGRLHEVKYKGKLVSEYVDDEEHGQRLYEEGLSFNTDYEIDEDAAAKLTAKAVLDAFERVQKVESERKRS